MAPRVWGCAGAGFRSVFRESIHVASINTPLEAECSLLNMTNFVSMNRLQVMNYTKNRIGERTIVSISGDPRTDEANPHAAFQRRFSSRTSGPSKRAHQNQKYRNTHSIHQLHLDAQGKCDRMDIQIYHYIQWGFYDLGVKHFVSKIKQGFRPSYSNYITLMMAASKVPDDQLAMNIFKIMRQDGFVPDRFALLTLVRALTRCGSYDVAITVAENSLIYTGRPDLEIIRQVAVPVCRSGSLEQRARIKQLIQDTKSHKLGQPDELRVLEFAMKCLTLLVQQKQNPASVADSSFVALLSDIDNDEELRTDPQIPMLLVELYLACGKVLEAMIVLKRRITEISDEYRSRSEKSGPVASLNKSVESLVEGETEPKQVQSRTHIRKKLQMQLTYLDPFIVETFKACRVPLEFGAAKSLYEARKSVSNLSPISAPLPSAYIHQLGKQGAQSPEKFQSFVEGLLHVREDLPFFEQFAGSFVQRHPNSEPSAQQLAWIDVGMREMWKRHMIPSNRLLDMVGRIIAKERDYPRAELLLKRMWSLDLANASSFEWMFRCLMSSSKQAIVASERREKVAALLELCKKKSYVQQTFRLTKRQVMVLAELGMFPEALQVINDFRSGYEQLSYWNRTKGIPIGLRHLPLHALMCAVTSVFVRNGILSGNLELVKHQVLEWIQHSPDTVSPTTLLYLLGSYGVTLGDLPAMISILEAVFQHAYQDKWTFSLESPVRIQESAHFLQPRLIKLIVHILETRTDGGTWVMLRSSLVTCVHHLEAEIRLLAEARSNIVDVGLETEREGAERMFVNDRLALLQYAWSNMLQALGGLQQQYAASEFQQVSSDIEIIIEMMNEKNSALSTLRQANGAEDISMKTSEKHQLGETRVEEASTGGIPENDGNGRAVRLVGRRRRPRSTTMKPFTS